MPEARTTHEVEFEELTQRIDLAQSPRQSVGQGDLDRAIVWGTFAGRVEVKLWLQLVAPEATLHRVLQSLLEVCRQ